MLGGLAAHLPTTHQVQPVQQELTDTTMSNETAGGAFRFNGKRHELSSIIRVVKLLRGFHLPVKPKLPAKVARRSLCVGSKPLLQSRCNRSQIAVYFTLQSLA